MIRRSCGGKSSLGRGCCGVVAWLDKFEPVVGWSTGWLWKSCAGGGGMSSPELAVAIDAGVVVDAAPTVGGPELSSRLVTSANRRCTTSRASSSTLRVTKGRFSFQVSTGCTGPLVSAVLGFLRDTLQQFAPNSCSQTRLLANSADIQAAGISKKGPGRTTVFP